MVVDGEAISDTRLLPPSAAISLSVRRRGSSPTEHRGCACMCMRTHARVRRRQQQQRFARRRGFIRREYSPPGILLAETDRFPARLQPSRHWQDEAIERCLRAAGAYTYTFREVWRPDGSLRDGPCTALLSFPNCFVETIPPL